MFDNLSNRFDGIFKRIRGKGRLTEADVDEVLKEIRTALLEADVNVSVVRNVVARIREGAIGISRKRRLIRASKSSNWLTKNSPTFLVAKPSRSPTPVVHPPWC